VPTIYKEPKGLFLLEGWAAGTPAVQPRHGAFPELIEGTGAGLLVEPESPADLADGLQTLIDDPQRRHELALRGRQAVESQYNAETMAERTLAIYETLTAEKSRPAARGTST
jgi:glycosyltransferase involved in cell wall biosynthesis